MDLQTIAGQIPDFGTFQTMHEQYAATQRLLQDYPGLIRVQTIGSTRAGDPIELITIDPDDNEKPNALAFAGAHPCEPVGCMTVEFLSRHLCENQALREEVGYRWHFIRCLDIDGMRLNENWFDKPLTPFNYYRHMFRPLMNEQPEMLFPIEYKTFKFDRPFPETLALKYAIDTLEPALMLSLHNAEFGGAYYYISRRLDAVFPILAEIPGWFDIPLDLGESDQAGYIEQYAPAIYRAITIRDSYERRVAAGMDDPISGVTWGGTSNGYAEARYNTLTLLPEVPYWTEARINDDTLTGISRSDVFAEMVDREETLFSLLKRLYERIEVQLTQDSPFRRAVLDRIHFYLGGIPNRRRWIAEDNTLARSATVAERFRIKYQKEHEWMRMRGMFLSMLDVEVAVGNDHSAFHIPREMIANNLHDVAAALAQELEYISLPIRDIVSVQVCAGLAAAAALKSEQLNDRSER
jgi:hypothetical protein